jgi:hypothetical protein
MDSQLDLVGGLQVTTSGGEQKGVAVWSQEQLDQWRLRWQAYLDDAASVAAHKEVDQRRTVMRREFTCLLQSFLDGAITVSRFNVAFQGLTHAPHNVFGLRGMSGGMFFNKLVKHLRDDEGLACHLRSTLVAPKETREGERRMRSLMRFLDTLIIEQRITRAQIQPARVPFFLSAWWHLQETRRWPMYYPLVQGVLTSEASPGQVSHDPVTDYFVFRAQFLALAKALDLSPWEMEHLVTWYGQGYASEQKLQERTLHEQPDAGITLQEPEEPLQKRRESLEKEPSQDMPRVEEGAISPKRDDEIHTHIQWLLAKIGLKVGCAVWVASNDHAKRWHNERLGDLSLPTLPSFADAAFQQIIRRIDVLWLHQETVVAAYEIEHTTPIATGLLRLYDLGVLCSHADYLCIVAPQERFRRIQFELSRPVFHTQQLHDKCRLIAEEVLLEHEEHILRWAGSLSVIDDLLRPFEEQRQP